MFYSEMSNRPVDFKAIILPEFCEMNAHNMKVLTIGCRTEAEIFSLVDLDLISIILQELICFLIPGDVTNLKYNENEFDLSVCGWVLEFVKTSKKQYLKFVGSLSKTAT